MEADQSMTLKDLPVNTRNYTIIDNITGKPIDQANYSLTIDPEVIKKLNKLKIVNEEKVKQAALRGQYEDTNLVSTFTPTDNAVFTPLYEGEYIDYHDFVDNTDKEEKAAEEATETTETEEETPVVEQEEDAYAPTEVVRSDNLLDRVVARDPSTIPQEAEETPEEQVPETDYITTANTVFDEKDINPDTVNQPVDNSTFTAEMTGLQQASEQIVQIDTNKLGPAIKPPKEAKPGTEKIKLDKQEIVEGKGVAWLAYLLFFIPLLFRGKNRFVRLHANEGLELNIMEILGVALTLPFLLVKTLTGTLQTVSLVAAIVGASILGACALTIIPMMVVAMCGVQFQIPWLWRKRMIHVSTER